MKKLFKCSVCGFISEGEAAPEKCPKCVAAFNQAKNEAWIIKQRSKTELAGHMNLGKW